MPTTEIKKIKRSELAHFINTTPKTQTPTWSRFGKGVTSQSVAMNPTVNSEQYVDEDSATSSLDAYAPTINTPQTAFKGEPVFDYVIGLYRERAIGADAETEILEVHLFEGDNTSGYFAQKQKVTVSITDFGGDAGSSPVLTYDLNYIGDPVVGTVKVASGGTVTFTEKGSA